MMRERPRDDGRLLVVSPHLDDAVLGCAQLLAVSADAVVLTVFAGKAEDEVLRTDWDAACGFASAGEAMRARAREDDAALAVLGARACRLEFPDDQYRRGSASIDPNALAEAVRAALHRYRPQTVAIPCGLFHRDHELAHAAALHVCRSETSREWLAYEDAFYRRIPGLLQQRLCWLDRAGIEATPLALAHGDAGLKRRAVHCYASQMRGLASPGRPGELDAFAPEGYWRLTLRTRDGGPECQ